MPLLENPDENPCWGCGPQHPRGLRLQFSREGDEVVTTYAPKDDEVGWPGLLHTGLHFAVLFEASYWAALELTGRLHVATGPQIFDQQRLPRTGHPFAVAARLVAREPLTVEARSTDHRGKPCATLRTTWRAYTRGAMARSGTTLPAYLVEAMPDEAAEANG